MNTFDMTHMELQALTYLNLCMKKQLHLVILVENFLSSVGKKPTK